jgi:hypothetical protein
MVQRMSCRHTLVTALLGLACALLATGNAWAGSLIINITDGITAYDIFDQVFPDVNPSINQIQADTAPLVFADFNIVGLTASTNNPGSGSPDGATLTVGGHIQRTTGGGPVTLSITAYQTDFFFPDDSSLDMTSASSSSFSNVPAGSTQTFESWYNPTSPATPPPPFGIPAPLILLPLAGTGSSGDTENLLGLPGSSPFSLTNQIVLTIGGATGTTFPDIVFGGQTQILAAAAVPEPATLLLLGRTRARLVMGARAASAAASGRARPPWTPP